MSQDTGTVMDGGLFAGIFARGAVAAAVDDGAWLRAMLTAEAALARAQARSGLLDPADADAIAAACRPGTVATAEIGRAAAGGGNPVIPLVKAITAAVPGGAARFVHQGATSQDILDTATMLLCRDACALLATDLADLDEALAALATRHRDTPMAGRTLLQQALPTTFGAVVAGWLHGLDAAADRLTEVAERRLAVQLGGAAGTLASLGAAGPQVVAAFAAELDLAEPILPWHTERGRIAELAGALGGVSGIVAKAARDITLLAQTEVAEVHEEAPGAGGSSAMPHKRNPIAAVSALACATQVPGLVGTLFGVMAQEHQRAAGSWHAEWLPLRQLLALTGAAVSWLRASTGRLRVDPERMRVNLAATGGLALSERVTADLTPDLGRLAAHERVRDACAKATATGADLADALAEALAGLRSRAEIERLLDPAGYLGSAPEFVDRALAARRPTPTDQPP